MKILKGHTYYFTGIAKSAAPFEGKSVSVSYINELSGYVRVTREEGVGTCTLPFFLKNYSPLLPSHTYAQEEEMGKESKLAAGEQYIDISQKIDEACDTTHYDFTYKLTEKDIENGYIRVDPYWVSNQWKLGEKDPSGCAFHILKTLARLFTKKGNTKQREIESIQKTAKRMEEIHNAE